MAAQVDALAQCPPETFRPSAQKVHGAGLVRRPPSLAFPDSGIHSWMHPAPPTRSTEAAHADAKHRNTPDSAPGTAALPFSVTLPTTTASAVAGLATMSSGNVPRTVRSEVSTDVLPRTAAQPLAPEAPTPPNRPLAPSTSICPDVAVSQPQLPPRTGLKRRRDPTDVDGTDTATRSRKKRRLRRFLITSRLSQPFSLPATHILNRESLATGDKRFLKMAAIMNARRIVPLLVPSLSPSAASSTHMASSTGPASAHYPTNTGSLLHRAAVANRLRKRLFDEVTATGRPIMTRDVPVQLMASARFSAVSAGGTAGRATTVPAAAASTLPLPRVPAGLRSTLIRPHTHTHAHPVATRTGLATGLMPAPIVRISPRLRPVADCTPVPSLFLHRDEEHKGDDDGSVPHHDDDDDGESERYDYGASDDPEDVYADFGVLFGGGSDDEWDEEGIDDIMDELDGIAHLSKKE